MYLYKYNIDRIYLKEMSYYNINTYKHYYKHRLKKISLI